eukprot:TRINITY_DN22521_c0_g1_i1.p1 TRINITY_DN22521_c0_g1~~TRINITY_DN22521_c0_g1_i1.p1  ORF type:complete len:731 (-),score=171.08 TRINITY_DN22521_c0_g1_i1:336-2528(-)
MIKRFCLNVIRKTLNVDVIEKPSDSDSGKTPFDFGKPDHDWALLADAISEEDLDAVRRLVNSGVSCRVIDRNGWSPLHHAVSIGHVPIAAFLVECGADVNATTRTRSTPLHYAAVFEHTCSVEFLLRHNVDVNAQDHLDSTPLHYAARHQTADICRLLLEAGADVHLRDYLKISCSRLLKLSGSRAIRTLLTEHRLRQAEAERKRRTLAAAGGTPPRPASRRRRSSLEPKPPPPTNAAVAAVARAVRRSNSQPHMAEALERQSSRNRDLLGPLLAAVSGPEPVKPAATASGPRSPERRMTAAACSTPASPESRCSETGGEGADRLSNDSSASSHGSLLFAEHTVLSSEPHKPAANRKQTLPRLRDSSVESAISIHTPRSADSFVQDAAAALSGPTSPRVLLTPLDRRSSPLALQAADSSNSVDSLSFPVGPLPEGRTPALPRLSDGRGTSTAGPTNLPGMTSSGSSGTMPPAAESPRVRGLSASSPLHSPAQSRALSPPAAPRLVLGPGGLSNVLNVVPVSPGRAAHPPSAHRSGGTSPVRSIQGPTPLSAPASALDRGADRGPLDSWLAADGSTSADEPSPPAGTLRRSSQSLENTARPVLIPPRNRRLSLSPDVEAETMGQRRAEGSLHDQLNRRQFPLPIGTGLAKPTPRRASLADSSVARQAASRAAAGRYGVDFAGGPLLAPLPGGGATGELPIVERRGSLGALPVHPAGAALRAVPAARRFEAT